MKKTLERNIWHHKNAKRMEGVHSTTSGNASNINGGRFNIREITEKEKAQGIDITELLK